MAAHHDDNWYIEGIRESDTSVFSDFFDEYYLDLVMFCGNYVRNLQTCEAIVTSVFLSVWEKRVTLAPGRPIKPYLITAVRNRAMNEIRHHKVKDVHERRVLEDSILEINDVENYIFYSELKSNYDSIVDGLPETIRDTFLMFMEDGMKTMDISKKMNITQRAVEMRLKKALDMIKKSLTHMGAIVSALMLLR